MQRLSFLFSIFTLYLSIIFAQDFQVTNMNGYVVENPKFSIANGNVYLTFATNTKLYKFPVSGPQTPISDPINFDPSFWGPSVVDIAASGNYVYTIVNDYKYPYFIERIGYSSNAALDWNNFTIDTIQLTNYIPIRWDVPKVIVSSQGNPYFFYYVFENQNDTSGLYLYTFGGYKKLDVYSPTARYEYGISPFVITKNNVDHIYVAYFIDSSYYFIHSSDGGQNFSQPKIIQNFKVMWPSDWFRSRFQLDNNGKLYFYYFYRYFGMPGPGQPPEDKMYHLVTSSTDWGTNWSEPILIDTNFYDLDFRIVENMFVKSYVEQNNLYIQSSTDLINWSDRVRVNSVDSSVMADFSTEVYNNKLAFAWKDHRTGNDEIFYRLMDIPTDVVENTIPAQFNLYQNFPNPFNPITTISFTLNQKAKTSLRVFDIFGKLVKEILNDELEAGEYNLEFNANGLSSGTYFYQLTSGNFRETKKMILIK